MKLKRYPPQLIRVLRKEYPAVGLIRIIFSCSFVGNHKYYGSGSHIKLFFPRDNQVTPVLPTLGEKGPIWPPANVKPIVRTYTLRYFDESTSELAVEFVDHQDFGVASVWAKNCSVGDCIGFAGPGGPAPLIRPSDWQVLIGDSSAIPAISGILEDGISDQNPDVYILGPKDISLTTSQEIPCNLNKLKQHKYQESLIESFDAMIHERQGKGFGIEACSVWVGGENSLVLLVRNYFKQKLGLTKQSMYAVPYWRDGQNEEQYHEERHTIMDAVY